MRLVDRVASFLFDRRMLLVLDNFEHVATAATVVAEVLAACPLLDVLATSRGSLRLSAEANFPSPHSRCRIPSAATNSMRWAPTQESSSS